MNRFTLTTRFLIGLMLFIGVAVVSGAEYEVTISTGHTRISTEDGPVKVDKIKLAKVKAAFLVNFLKFTKWPDDAFESEQSPIRVCIVGKSPVGQYLESALKSAKVHGRSVLMERESIPSRRQFNSVEEFESNTAEFLARLAQYHMIYISQYDTAIVNDLLNDMNLRKTLIVSDERKILFTGGHLAFLITNGHVAFSASVTNIQKTGLKVSSKLLRLAQSTK